MDGDLNISMLKLPSFSCQGSGFGLLIIGWLKKQTNKPLKYNRALWSVQIRAFNNTRFLTAIKVRSKVHTAFLQLMLVCPYSLKAWILAMEHRRGRWYGCWTPKHIQLNEWIPILKYYWVVSRQGLQTKIWRAEKSKKSLKNKNKKIHAWSEPQK